MRKSFKSNDFNFRPTSLAHALHDAGAIEAIALVREPKRSIDTIVETNDGDRYERHNIGFTPIPHRRAA